MLLSGISLSGQAAEVWWFLSPFRGRTQRVL